MGHYPIIKIFLVFLAGQIIGLGMTVPVIKLSILILALIASLVILQSFPVYRLRWMFGMIALTGFFLFGISWPSMQDHNGRTRPKVNEHRVFAARLLHRPVGKASSYHCYAELYLPDTGSRYLPLRALLYFEKDSSLQYPDYGEVILVNAGIQVPEGRKNPEDFDFKSYLATRKVYYTVYLKSGSWLTTGRKQLNPLFALSARIHESMTEALGSLELGRDEMGIAAAMILGDKEYLDRELSSSFADAGAVHILCVSGLHVGVIYMISGFLFSFIRSKKLRMILVLLIIWSFAMVTGLSPPVLRASVMFTAISVSSLAKRESNIFNNIALSAFLLLLSDSRMILQPGFQLSYSAVLGIVIFQPFIAGWWTPPWKIISRGWELTAVSVSAQIGTLPLSLLYFQQFPNYFILTNLVVIPLTAVVIYAGLVMTVLSLTGIAFAPLALVFQCLLRFLRHFIGFISQLPGSVTGFLWPDIFSALILFIIIFLLALFVLSGNKRALVMALITVVVLAGSLTCRKYENLARSEWMVFSTNRGWLVSATGGGEQVFLADSTAVSDTWTRSVMLSHRHYGLPARILLAGDHYSNGSVTVAGDHCFAGSSSLVILSKNNERASFIPNQRIDHLVVTSGVSTGALGSTGGFGIKNVVLLREMKRWERDQWKEWCNDRGISVHDIREKGAFLVGKKRQGSLILAPGIF